MDIEDRLQRFTWQIVDISEEERKMDKPNNQRIKLLLHIKTYRRQVKIMDRNLYYYSVFLV